MASKWYRAKDEWHKVISEFRDGQILELVWMHGTKTYLPNKWKFFAKVVPNLQADVIAF